MMKHGWTLLGVFLLCLGCSNAQLTWEDYTSLPACMDVDLDAYNAAVASAPCDAFGANPTVVSCPAGCGEALDLIGKECYASIRSLEFASIFGTTISEEPLMSLANATFLACETGTPVDAAVQAAFVNEALSFYPSCAAADYGAALVAGCTILEAVDFITFCQSECADYRKALGQQCFADIAVSGAEVLGLEYEGIEDDAREVFEDVFNDCVPSRRRSRALMSKIVHARSEQIHRLLQIVASAAGPNIIVLANR